MSFDWSDPFTDPDLIDAGRVDPRDDLDERSLFERFPCAADCSCRGTYQPVTAPRDGLGLEGPVGLPTPATSE